MTTVMVFGTFDIVHLGHIDLFRQAKKYGDSLIVVVAKDETVKKTKGRLPVHSEKERARLVSEIRLVDRAVLGSSANKYAAITRYRPDVIALGYDQITFVDGLAALLARHNMNTKIVRLKPYRSNTHKSHKIKQHIERML